MTKDQAVELAIKSMHVISCNHDDRLKLIDAEGILRELIKPKE